jgi:hypothetical protein
MRGECQPPIQLTERGFMNRVLAIVMILSGWTLLSQDASAQNIDRRSMPPLQAIPTVEDAPQGTTENLSAIGSVVNSTSSNLRFQPQPVFSDFSGSQFRFSTLNQPYTSYSNLSFEAPITPDHVKLRVNFEPDREGGNFGLGLPLE